MTGATGFDQNGEFGLVTTDFIDVENDAVLHHLVKGGEKRFYLKKKESRQTFILPDHNQNPVEVDVDDQTIIQIVGADNTLNDTILGLLGQIPAEQQVYVLKFYKLIYFTPKTIYCV